MSGQHDIQVHGKAMETVDYSIWPNLEPIEAHWSLTIITILWSPKSGREDFIPFNGFAQ